MNEAWAQYGVAGVYVTGTGTPSGNAELDGLLVINAGRNLNANAAAIGNGSQGTTVLQAKNDLTLGTVTEQQQQRLGIGAANNATSSSTNQAGTTVKANGDVVLSAGNDISARAATVDAQGALVLKAERDISIDSAQNSQDRDSTRHNVSSDAMSSTTVTRRNNELTTTAQGSSLGGATVSLNAGRDVAVRGSEVIGNQGVQIGAGRDVSITAAQNTQSTSSFSRKDKDGWSSSCSSVSFGKQQNSNDTKERSTSAAASTVGAINGNVVISAGGTYKQVGSDVLALAGDKGLVSESAGNLSIAAKRIDVVEARETGKNSTETKTLQTGLTTAVSAPVASAVQGAAAQLDAAGKTGSGRMQLLAGANVAMGMSDAAQKMQAAPAQAGGVNVSVSYGTSKSQTNTEHRSDGARGSSLNAAGNISLRATGDGANSDTTLQGVSVKAGGTASLKADDQINLLAASNTSEDHSRNKSSSGSIGVAAGSGGVGYTASASMAKGNSDANTSTWSNTRIEAGSVVLESGGDTTLKGAVVSANSVRADIGGNLVIESLQDTAAYKERQKSVSASGTVGAGTSVSVSAGSTKIDSVFTSVGE